MRAHVRMDLFLHYITKHKFSFIFKSYSVIKYNSIFKNVQTTLSSIIIYVNLIFVCQKNFKFVFVYVDIHALYFPLRTS